MTITNVLGVVVVGSTIGVSAGVCQTNATQEPRNDVHATAAPEPGRQPNNSEQAVVAAREWLEGLKTKENTKLAARTRLPFTYATTNGKKACDGTVADIKKLAALVDCIGKRDKILIEEMNQAGKLRLNVIGIGQIPPSLTKLIGAPAAGEQLVSTFINGDGITFELVLSVAAGAAGSVATVRALFVNAEVESG